MLFNSVPFLFVFLPVTIIGFWVVAQIVSHQAARLWLLAASLVFYGWFEWRYLILIGASIVINYGLAVTMRRCGAAGRPHQARAVLILGIVSNVGALVYFKYVDFLIQSLAFTFGFEPAVFQILLPLAISFFTFQQIAYLVDSYQGQVADHGLLEYALFVAFFPQLIAGPIVHHSEMMPQFRRQDVYRLNFEYVDLGMVLLLLGLFKKVVMADGVAPLANDAFGAASAGAPVTFFEAWFGTLAFMLQIYFDFSGYSDMAIGLALMFGINLPENFRSPYQARNIVEFWRRWHMTLSRFLRDYIYIPLGGNRQGPSRRYANLLATMLIGGLWHGAAWTFVIWGALHGLYLVVNHFWAWVRRNVLGFGDDFAPARGLVGWALTFFAVGFAWVFFRAEDLHAAATMVSGMIGQNGIALPSMAATLVDVPQSWLDAPAQTTLFGERHFYELVGSLCLMLTGFAIVLFGRPMLAIRPEMRRLLLIPTAAFALKAVVFGDAAADFIYFQF